MKLLTLPVAALVVAAMSGCGGGGGAASDTIVSLTGTAFKGTLRGAEVQAFQVINGERVKYGAPVTTGAGGDYELKLAATSNPVIVEITSKSGTKMLDETQVGANGKFVEIDAPSGLTLRTMVPDLTANADTQANPYTEMAVAGALAATDAAGNKLSLTKDILLASKEVVKTQLGMNPFAIKAVDADSTTASTDQKTMMTMLTGLAKAGKDDAACNVACQVKTLGDKATVKYDSSTGKGNFKDTAAVSTVLNTTTAKATNVTGNPLVVSIPTFTAVSDTAVASTTEIAARDSFESFLKVMREGITKAADILDKSKTTIEDRTKGLTFATAKAGMDAFNAASVNCSFANNLISCSGNNVTKISDGSYSISYTSNSYKNTATVSGSVASGVGSLSITADSIANFDNKKYASLSVSGTVSGLNSSNQLVGDGTAKLNMGITAYDDKNVNPVSVKLSDLSVVVSNSQKKLDGSGTVSIDDQGVGSLSGAVKVTLEKKGPSDTQLEAYPTFAALNLTGKDSTNKLISLDLSATVDYTSYAQPWSANTSSNYPKGQVTASIGLVDDSVKLSLTANKTAYDKGDIKAVFSSGGNNVTATANLVKDMNGTTISSDGILFTSSSGNFTATVTKNSSTGKSTGIIKQGSVQIGTIENGTIMAGGQILSLK